MYVYVYIYIYIHIYIYTYIYLYIYTKSILECLLAPRPGLFIGGKGRKLPKDRVE